MIGYLNIKNNMDDPELLIKLKQSQIVRATNKLSKMHQELTI